MISESKLGQLKETYVPEYLTFREIIISSNTSQDVPFPVSWALWVSDMYVLTHLILTILLWPNTILVPIL